MMPFTCWLSLVPNLSWYLCVCAWQNVSPIACWFYFSVLTHPSPYTGQDVSTSCLLTFFWFLICHSFCAQQIVSDTHLLTHPHSISWLVPLPHWTESECPHLLILFQCSYSSLTLCWIGCEYLLFADFLLVPDLSLFLCLTDCEWHSLAHSPSFYFLTCPSFTLNRK